MGDALYIVHDGDSKLGRKVFPIWSTKNTLPLYGIKVSMNFQLAI